MPSTSRKQAYTRRSSESVTALVEKVEAAIRNQPGASIREICRDVQAELSELARPMVILRETGKIRTVGAPRSLWQPKERLRQITIGRISRSA